jgi:hypothetical protein
MVNYSASIDSIEDNARGALGSISEDPEGSPPRRYGSGKKIYTVHLSSSGGAAGSMSFVFIAKLGVCLSPRSGS